MQKLIKQTLYQFLTEFKLKALTQKNKKFQRDVRI